MSGNEFASFLGGMTKLCLGKSLLRVLTEPISELLRNLKSTCTIILELMIK
jgi:hypothetical protein